MSVENLLETRSQMMCLSSMTM